MSAYWNYSQPYGVNSFESADLMHEDTIKEEVKGRGCSWYARAKWIAMERMPHDMISTISLLK